jgi:iron complex outermembrane receptor protein
LLLIFSFAAHSQNASIIGKVINAEEMSPLANINVELSEKGVRAATDEKGVVRFDNLPAGVYTLKVSVVGFKSVKKTVTLGEANLAVDIVLQSEPIGMNEVVISGYRESYTTGDNYSASRTNAPMMTLPLSTGQVSNKLLADQNTTNVNDAMRNVSGVVTEFGGPHPLIVNIRGFIAPVFKDGFRIGGNNNLSAGGDDLPISTIALDRIEVLKGPSTILYGRGEPGGIVNFISKQPKASPEYDLETMVGSFQQYRIGGSATGPVLVQENFAYRMDASYEKSNSYRDKVKSSTWFAKPSFSIHATDRTRIYLSAEMVGSEFTPDHGILMLPKFTPGGNLTGSLAPISSRSYFYGDESDRTNQKQQRAVAEVEHVITPEWTLRVGANYEHVIQESSYMWDWFYTFEGANHPLFAPGAVPANWMIRLFDVMNSTRTDLGARVENHVRFNHSLLGTEIEHAILVVADALKIETMLNIDYNFKQILDPATGNRQVLSVPVAPHEENAAVSKDYGISIQDLITFGGRWHLMVGGRFESNVVDVTQLVAFSTDPTSTQNKSTGFVPRIGALYQVYDNLSLYASYMGSYQSPGADYGLWDLTPELKPERAYQLEAGAKLELLNKRALITAAVFTINKYDVIAAEQIPGVPPKIVYYNIGREDAQGVDLDVVGEITSNLRISAAFNAQTMKFTNPSRKIIDGKHRYGTPTYTGNLWALYEFTDGFLNGLGIGGGAAMKSAVFVNDANEVEVPAYTTFDAAAYYDLSNLRFQMNLYNVSDELAYTVAGIGGFGNPTSPYLVMPIAPFRVNFTIRYRIR